MDKIRLEIGKRDDVAAGLVDQVLIFINDRNLIDTVREVELPFAARQGKPDLAGSYAGLPPEDVFLPSPRLLGEPVTYYDYDNPGKIAVLGCTCGEPGCWPFLVKITLHEGVVIWSDFEQPHRSGREGTTVWRYDELQSFVFERKQYVAALSENLGES